LVNRRKDVACLFKIFGFRLCHRAWNRRSRNELGALAIRPALDRGWAFTAGIFYMALFISLDPGIPAHMRAGTVLLILMGLMLGLSIVGFLSALFNIYAQQRAEADAASGGPRRSA